MSVAERRSGEHNVLWTRGRTTSRSCRHDLAARKRRWYAGRNNNHRGYTRAEHDAI